MRSRPGTNPRWNAALLSAAAILAAVVALALPAAGQAASDDSCPPEATRTAEIADVVDGDTVRLADGTVVRLAGVAAPKRPLGRAAEDPWAPAEAARAALDDLVGGTRVSLATVGAENDRYGRMRAHLALEDGRWVQAALLSRGAVRVRAQADEMMCFSALVGAEETARAAGRGLWRDPDYAIKAADDPSLPDRKGLYEIVEGRVLSVGHGRRMIFLDFGSDYRRDFTIMVNPALAERLAEAGLAVDGLQGRRVRVRGVIEESGGPAIRISHPAELELLDD